MTLKAEEWNALMGEVMEMAELETANYTPGNVSAPGSGSAGDDPLGLEYVDRGPLAFVLCEALDAAVIRGLDRDSLIEQIGRAADAGPEDVEEVLEGDVTCPPMETLAAFASALSIDMDIILDAATKGGCTQYGFTGPVAS